MLEQADVRHSAITVISDIEAVRRVGGTPTMEGDQLGGHLPRPTILCARGADQSIESQPLFLILNREHREATLLSPGGGGNWATPSSA